MQRDLLKLLKLILATYRLTYLLHNEDGPGDIFKQIRSAVGIEEREIHNDFGTEKINEVVDENLFSKLLSCPYCLSGWIVLILLVMPQIIIDWLAIWGGVFLILKRDD